MRFISLFSGIEAASQAWQPLGWECVAVAEIDKFPCAVLAHHYPDVPNLGDVTTITEAQIQALGQIDVVVGGFPCQDVSVAGKRAGLKHGDGTATRSGLFFDAMRIARWTKARFVVIENVQGLFSSHGGRDFACVVSDMAGCEFSVPTEGWRNTGAAVGPNGLVEWSVLDAQWWGLAQRRKRVFLVLDTGNWRDRPPILLEQSSLRGDPAPSRETWERTAPTIAARTKGGGGLGTDFDCDGGLIAHSLKSDGFDASEDGTGRGIPLVSPALKSRDYKGPSSDGDGDGDGAPLIPVAFDCKRNPAEQSDLAPTLRAMPHDGSHANAGGQIAVAFAQNQREEVREMEIAGAVASMRRGDAKQETLLAFDPRFARNDRGGPDEVVAPLKAESGRTGKGDGAPCVASATMVRRLTPRECERLMGMPDDYTLIPYRGKPASYGPRYKSLGNSFAVPVVRWIGERIKAASAAARPACPAFRKS